MLVRGTRYEPHNNWLLVGIELGITGLTLFTAGLALSVREGLRLHGRVRAAALGSLIGVMSTGLLLSNFEFKYFWFAMLFVALAVNAQASELSSPAAAGEVGDDPRDAVAVAPPEPVATAWGTI